MSRTTPDDATAPAGPAERAGLSIAQYDWHVRDMAKNLLHAAGLYVVLQAAALTKLLPHPFFHEPGGGWWEAGLFVCGFLGAWAIVYSTLLRDAGLRSWTVTILVPLTAVAVGLIWAVLPAVQDISPSQLGLALGALSVPGPIAWVLTMRRWGIERRRAIVLLADEAAS